MKNVIFKCLKLNWKCDKDRRLIAHGISFDELMENLKWIEWIAYQSRQGVLNGITLDIHVIRKVSS